MPVLKNARHELFAQEIAKGKSATDAYVIAGYKPNRGNAATLARSNEVRDRVIQINTKAAEKTVLTIEKATALALELVTEGRASGQTGAAVSALGLASKLNGLITDKTRAEVDIAPDRAALERAVIDAMGANIVPVPAKVRNEDGETLQ